MKNNKTLLIYGWLLLAIAILDLAMLVLDFIGGDFAMVTHEDQLVENLANAVIIIVLSISILSILIGGYLGIKGVLEAKNPTNATLHIILAKIIAVINVVLAVLFAIAMIGTNDLFGDIVTPSLCVLDAVIMFSYAKEAKAVQTNKQ